MKDILKEKCHRKVTKSVLFLHDNAPAHLALATQKKLAYLGFQCLDHPPYSPDLALSDYHLFPGLKNHWKVTIFHPAWRSLLLWRPGWMDNFLNFFWVVCKSYSNGLRSELSFVGSMLSLVAVACFLPGQAKDLSAPPHTDNSYSGTNLHHLLFYLSQHSIYSISSNILT